MLCLVKFPGVVILLLLCALMWDCFAVNVSDLIQPTGRRKESSLLGTTKIHHLPKLISSIFVNSTSQRPLKLLSSFNDHQTSISKQGVHHSQLFSVTSGKRFTSTSCFHDGNTVICTAISTISTALLAASSTGVFKNGNCSSVITNSTQMNTNLTEGKYLANQTTCSGKDGCYRYGARWINFYVDIGGWIMLAVVLCGILSLIITHFLGRRHAISNDFYSGVKSSDVARRYSFI